MAMAEVDRGVLAVVGSGWRRAGAAPPACRRRASFGERPQTLSDHARHWSVPTPKSARPTSPRRSLACQTPTQVCVRQSIASSTIASASCRLWRLAFPAKVSNILKNKKKMPASRLSFLGSRLQLCTISSRRTPPSVQMRLPCPYPLRFGTSCGVVAHGRRGAPLGQRNEDAI